MPSCGIWNSFRTLQETHYVFSTEPSRLMLLSRTTGCGSVTNNSTWVRIRYRIYSLWRFSDAHITVVEKILILAIVAS
jgi:hypothetical protein